MTKALLKIGQEIHQARTRLGLSKNKVASDLKLSSKYLQKIEAGTLDVEYRPVFIIRYLRIYLNYFNLDSEALIQQYNDALFKNKKKKPNNRFSSFSYTIYKKDLVNFSIFMILFLISLNMYFVKKERDYLKENLSEDALVLYRN